MSDSLEPHGLEHARPPCPLLTPGVCSDSWPSSQWCHPTTLSSVVPFSSCLQSFPASGSFPMSQFFASGGQSTGALASASVLPMNTQDQNYFSIMKKVRLPRKISHIWDPPASHLTGNNLTKPLLKCFLLLTIRAETEERLCKDLLLLPCVFWIFFLFFIFYWSIVDLQCCVSFRCYYVSLPKENLPQEIQIWQALYVSPEAEEIRKIFDYNCQIRTGRYCISFFSLQN